MRKQALIKENFVLEGSISYKLKVIGASLLANGPPRAFEVEGEEEDDERLPELIWNSDYYPLLVVQAGSDDTNERGLKGEGVETRLSRDEPKGGKPELEVISAAQLKCMYTNARSMGNEQEELEAIVQQESYDVVTITETWWDDSHDWSAAMGGCKLFRRDRQGRRSGGVALYVRESLDSVELEVSNDKVECLWTRIRAKVNKADILVGDCYRPPNQDDEGDELS
ncbi:hypothetical protein BTVI_57818 [Pitangus sulphuratus]|nr:hypothetical protein BTVI_57818 [Pitangus sulphuratus]